MQPILNKMLSLFYMFIYSDMNQAWYKLGNDFDQIQYYKQVETAARVPVSLEMEFHARLRITTATKATKTVLGLQPRNSGKAICTLWKGWGTQKLKNDQSKQGSSSTILLCWFQGTKSHSIKVLLWKMPVKCQRFARLGWTNCSGVKV